MNPTGYVEHMRDADVVASIVAGEPAGLAVAYDRYAGDLYGYCLSLLREPDDAADAVQDTFVIAASKLSGLREPDRLRAWLFAVARNEALHRLRSRRTAASLQDAPELADESADVSRPAERAETIALVRAAAAGLNDGERDVMNQVWHGLEVPEVADVLGVSRNHAYSLFSRARDQLEASVGVLLVGRTGRRDCAALDELLGDWDGRLTARLRRKVGRHIDHCGVCSDRRRRELSPAMLYSLTPGALLALAARCLAPPHPGALQAGTLSGTAAAHPLSFSSSGFPRAAHFGQLSALPRPHLPLTVVGGTAVAATATVVATAVGVHVPMPAGHQPGGGPPAAVAAVAPGATGAASGGVPRSGSSATPNALIWQSPGAAGRHGPRSARGKQAAQVSGGPSSSPASGADPSAAPAANASDGATAVPPAAGPTPAATVGATAEPTASGGVTATASGPTATVATSAAAAGTLTVSPTTVVLSGLSSGSITLTASGGPVSWSIDEPASLLGTVTVAPSAGQLTAGQSVTVSIRATVLLSLDSQLTVEPGGQAVTVVLGLG